jgi:uncharacterized protein (TIGR02246 family)
MKANPAITQDVMAVLQAYADAYGAGDADAIAALFAADADLVFFGTGSDERRVGADGIRRQAERDLSQCESLSMVFNWSAVSASGSVAWASTELTVSWQIDGKRFELPARYSTVLEQRAGRWLMVQGHFSFPASDQSEGNSFPAAG